MFPSGIPGYTLRTTGECLFATRVSPSLQLNHISIFQLHLQVEPVFANSEKFQRAAGNPAMKALIWVLLKLYTLIGMGWCLAPLVYLTAWKWWSVFCSCWFLGFLVWFTWPIYVPILKSLLGSKRKTEKKDK